MPPRQRYCKIAGCKYYQGTSDRNVHMFRIPSEVEMRQKWEQILSKVRTTSSNLICMEHFDSKDLIVGKNVLILRKGSVPSIFESAILHTETVLDIDYTTDNDFNANVIDTADFVSTDVLICEQCLTLNDHLSAANNRCTELETENRINKDKIHQLLEQIEVLKNQLERSDLARFAINNDFIDEKAQRVNERQKQILTCLAVGIDHRKSYPPIVRNFCISLKNISPAAYRFFRNEFSDRIPTIGTITAWHSNSDINANPGIQKQALELIKRKAAEKNGKLVGALSFDEMGIHKMVQCVNGEMIGYEYLPGMDRRTANLATQALVFLFNGINEDIQIPVAYYFVSSSDSIEKSKVLCGVIEALLRCGIVLTSITFDGHKTNPKICADLGADLNVFSNAYKPSFEVAGCQVRNIFDPSHMQKLVRSTLGANKELFDSERKPIKWEYFKRLVKFKEQRNMGSIIKISQAHIDYGAKPMKVKLAVELLSNSNANLMEQFMNQGFAEFQGATPTITYTKMFNDVFDVFNSTTDSNGNLLKRVMSVTNISVIVELFEKAIKYIKGLHIRSAGGRLIPICTSTFKTAYIGYIANMKNLLDIFNELIIEKNVIQSIATHKLSQDHLEVMFGKIRSLCGSNNNPNCQQFNSALRKLLANTAIQYSNEGNCIVLEHMQVYNPFSNISTITSRKPKFMKENQFRFTPEEIEDVLQELSEIQESSRTNQLADLSDLNTAYIASVIEQRIETRDEFQTECEQCKRIFMTNEKIPNAFVTSINTRRACQSTYDIGKAAEHILKMDILKGQFEPTLIYETIYSSLNLDSLYTTSSCEEHSEQTKLIEHILQQFIRIKCNYLAKRTTFESRDKNIRQKLTRLIINLNQ